LALRPSKVKTKTALAKASKNGFKNKTGLNDYITEYNKQYKTIKLLFNYSFIH